MTTLQAVVLGIVQGLGEFLPISSSGHLIVVPWLLGWEDHGLAFDVALHLGTLLAVVAAFARDWWRLLSSGVRCLWRARPFEEPEARTLWRIALASVPGAVIGFLLDHWAETTFRAPLLVAVNMALLGLVLFWADGRSTSQESREVTTGHAFLIGLAQAAAILPGVSRSGSTISAALFLGYGRAEAARFSFLMATPITLGAALVKVPKLLAAGGGGPVLWWGMAAAAITGFLAIKLLLALVRTHDYRPFVYYRWAFALLVAAVALVRRVGVV
ncbi:MAG TPA: undecaprenyl-diphosphate phosphatase [Vicinamibacteria bacterium]